MASSATVWIESVNVSESRVAQSIRPLAQATWTVNVELGFVGTNAEQGETMRLALEIGGVNSVDQAVVRALHLTEQFGTDLAKACQKAIRAHESSRKPDPQNRT
jgi:hypothetical protein